MSYEEYIVALSDMVKEFSSTVEDPEIDFLEIEQKATAEFVLKMVEISLGFSNEKPNRVKEIYHEFQKILWTAILSYTRGE